MQAIFASTEAGAFGKGDRMPWPSIKEDFAHFKAVTMGQTLAAAKTTLNSLPPLKGRTLELIKRGEEVKQNHIIIGGTSLLTLDNLGKCEVIWYTRVKGEFVADTYLPKEVMLYIDGLINSTNSELLVDSENCSIYKITKILS